MWQARNKARSALAPIPIVVGVDAVWIELVDGKGERERA
ncbi:MAG: hypothetical protein K0R62_8577 [Nonomuraea muscovyensis]|nr:hypothetical protein [Nonomuraea muscovyensis]